MRTPSRRQSLVAVVAVGAVACLGATLARPEPPTTPSGTVEPVVRSSAVCPRPTTEGSTTSALGLVSADVPDVEGQAVLADLRTGTKALLELDQPGTRDAATVPKSSRTAPAVLRAEGTLAPYVVAGQVTRTTQGSGRGLSAVACPRPTSESWFVGGGSAVGRRTTVWLSNPDSTQAVVDLQVFGPEGPVVGHGTTGIVVPPHRQTGVRLDVVTPGLSRTAVHVVARAGRVSAAVQDIDTKGLIPRGADYVPLAAAPTTHVVVPGVLSGTTGTRVLQVVAPGDADAIVNVRVVSADGTFTPEDASVLEVPAGSVAQVDLTSSLQGAGTASILLDSDVPVVAGVRTSLPRSEGSAEVTYSAGVAPLTGPGGFAPVPAADQDVPYLVLTAADTDASVVVSVLDPGAEQPAIRQVQVPAGTTVTTALSDLSNGAGIVVTPAEGSGPVQAALLVSRTDADGVLRSTVPLTSAPTTVTVPPVRPDPATGVPD